MQSRAWPLYSDTSGGMVSTSSRAYASAFHTVHGMSCVHCCLITLVWTRVSLESEWHILQAPSVFKSRSACSVATRNSEATIPLGIYMYSHVRSLTPLGTKSPTNPAYASYLASLRLLVPFSIYRENTVFYRGLVYLSNLYGYSTTFEPGLPSNRCSQAINLALLPLPPKIIIVVLRDAFPSRRRIFCANQAYNRPRKRSELA